MKKNSIEMITKNLKSCLKGKVGITTATVVAFMITGGVAFGNTLSFNDGGQHTVTEDISLINQGDGIAVSNGSKVIIDSNSSISIENDEWSGYSGVRLEDGELENNASINVSTGNGITGYQYDETGKRYEITNNGNISASNGDGINAQYSYDVYNKGDITVENGSGIRVEGDSEEITNEDKNKVINEGKIIVDNSNNNQYYNQESGIYAQYLDIENSGDIQVIGATRIVMDNSIYNEIEGAKKVTLTNSGNITSEGIVVEETYLVDDGSGELYEETHTIVVGGDGIVARNADINNTGEITAKNGSGIVLDNSATTIWNHETGKEEGFVGYEKGKIVNEGKIATEGAVIEQTYTWTDEDGEVHENTYTRVEGGDGIVARNVDIENTGDITTKNGDGIVLDNSATIIWDNETGEAKEVIEYEKGKVINEGDIVVEGVDIEGTYTWRDENGNLHEETSIQIEGGNGIVGRNADIKNTGDITTINGNGIILDNSANWNSNTLVVEYNKGKIINSGKIVTEGIVIEESYSWTDENGETHEGTYVRVEGGNGVVGRNVDIVNTGDIITKNGNGITLDNSPSTTWDSEEEIITQYEKGLLTNSGDIISEGTIVEEKYSWTDENGEVHEEIDKRVESGKGIVAINADVINSGNITTDGIGIFVKDGDLTNSGDINTSGKHSTGISIIKSNSSNEGAIKTEEDDSAGVLLGGDSTFVNKEEGGIKTKGKDSFGIVYWRGNDENGEPIYSTVNIENKGAIETSGDDSHGVLVASDYNEDTERSKVKNSGTITTSGSRSSGIDVDYSDVINSGTIITGSENTLSENSYGVGVYEHSTFLNDEDGEIITHGKNSSGINVSGNSIATNNGSVETTGENSSGINVFSDSTAINNGTITTIGYKSRGIIAGNATIENNGEIITLGDRSYGLFGYSNVDLTNNGTIKTTGEKGYGIKVSYGSTAINSKNGTIETSGYKGYGIIALDEGYVENNGSILTNGEKGIGISSGFGADGINSGNITTTGNNATGLRIETHTYDYDDFWNEETEQDEIILLKAESESTFTNSGTITTSGKGSKGVLIETATVWDGFYEDINEMEKEGYVKNGDWNYNHSLEKVSKFENSGTIETTGNNSFGIYAYTEKGLANSEVYNYENGMVKTTGDNAIGAYLDNSTLINEGTIETFGDEAYGIYADNSNVDNSGTIQTHGDDSFGIYAVNNSTVNHTGKIYVDDADAFGIVVDQTSELTISEDAVIEVGGESSNGIHVITTEQSEEEVMTMFVMSVSAVEEVERASLTNNGSITATGEGSNAIVLQDADFVNTGTVSSENGYAIVSSGGDNTVTLTESSNVDGVIAGGSGNDTLYLDGTNTDDFDVVAYESIVKTGGGIWTLEDSTIELEASKETVKVSSYTEAKTANNNVDGEIVIGDNTTISIAVDGDGNSGQIVASEIKVEGDISIDVDSSNNNGANEIAIENILVADKDGLDIDELGEVTMISDGWESDYAVNEDGTVDAIITRNTYTERVNSLYKEVARVLESNYTSDVTDDMRLVMNELNDLSNEEFNDGLEQISGNLYTSNVFLTNEVSKQFERNIRGFMNTGDLNNTNRSSRTLETENKQHVALIGGSSNYDGTSSTTGFDSDSYGFVGATELENGFGVSYGYVKTSVDYDDTKESSSDIKTFHGGLFHKFNNKGLKVNTNLAFDYSMNEVDRKISFGSIDRKATSDFDSYEISLGTELGYDFYVGDFVITPKTGVTYSRIEQDSISESGADSLNINMDSESYDSIRTNVGVDIARYLDTSHGTYKFALTGEWVHEFGDIYDDQDVSIDGADGDFKVEGLNVSEDTYRVGTQVELARTTGTTYFAGYTYEAESSYDNHMGTVGAKFSF